MKILYFSQFYKPESIAPAFRAAENSKLWMDMGHEVTVFTGYPNYPAGKIFEGYKPVLLSEENISGVKVLRSKLVAKPNTSTIKRLENALSYFFYGMINIFFNGNRIGKNYDVVLGTSGVVFNAWLAWIYASIHKKPFVFEIRDITYIQMQATGKSSNDLTVKGMRWLELYLCKKAKTIVAVTKGFKKTLVDEGIPAIKIKVVTNGVDVEQCKEVYNPRKKLILSYFGTLGISQNIADTFDYGKVISKIVKDFEYLIIGEGAQKKDIEIMASSDRLSFVSIFPGVSAERLEPYYKDTQLSVITLKKTDNFKYTLPSKLFQIMGRGIAILFIGPEGEAAEIVRENNAGIVLTGTKENDLRLLSDFFAENDWREKLQVMGENGRKAVEKKYSRKKLAKYFLEVLSAAI